MAARRKKQGSTRARAARKGWATRRAREAELLEKKRLANERRAETRRRKAEAHQKRVEAARKGYRKRLAKERARAALETWLEHAGQRDERGEFIRETKRLHDSWLRSKRELYTELDENLEDFLEVLDVISEETGTEWDIAYGPDGEAAA